MNKLIREICKREAGKSEVSVGNVRSVLKHLAEITAEDIDLCESWTDFKNKKYEKWLSKSIKKKKNCF